MTIHQVREILVELTTTEQLELAQWLIGRALNGDDASTPDNGQQPLFYLKAILVITRKLDCQPTVLIRH